MSEDKIKIIFEDEQVIVCYKPSGIPTQTAKLGAVDMYSWLKNYLHKSQTEKKEPYVAVIHRLDQPVEGLLVFAKTPFAAKELNKDMQGADFGKYYKAILCHVPREKSGLLKNYLVKDGKTNTSRIGLQTERAAKEAVLFYEVLAVGSGFEEYNRMCLVNVKLDTGRHHQIRVQMAHMGCPIWGDSKYGVENQIATVDKSWKQIALCAYRLEFVHPKTKKKMTFEIEPEGEGFLAFKA